MAITLIKGRKLSDPDPKLVHDQLQWFQAMYGIYGSAYLVRNLLWILRKNQEDDSQQEVPSEQWNRRLVPFKYNRIQHDLERKMGKRNICNKPRQAGYCVKKDTPVMLANGKWTTYDKLRRGSKIIDEFGLPATIKEVFRIPDFLHAYKGKATEVYSTAAVDPITTAPNHPWLTQRGMVESQKLTPQDYLLHPRRKVGPSVMEWSRDLGVVTGLHIGGARILGKTALQLNRVTLKKKRFVEVHALPRIYNVLHDRQMHTSTTEDWIQSELKSKIDERAWKFGRDFLIGILEGWLIARGDWYSRSIDVEIEDRVEVSWIIQICLSLGVGMPHLSGKNGKTKLRFGGDCYNNLHGLLYYRNLEGNGKREQYVDDNYVYVRVRKIKATKCDEFRDVEIDSKSHLYWLPLGLTHNTTFFINRRLYLPAVLEPGTGGLLISQKHSYATAHFGILQRVHRYVGCVDPMKPWKNLLHEQLQQNLLHLAYSNRKELIFDQLDSRIMVESAEVEEAGQGITLSHLVCTEVARWPGKPEETMANLKEAVAKDGTVDIESTPNGQGGYFFEEYNRAKRGGKDVEFTAHFHAWYWHDEYRLTPAMDEAELDEDEQRKKALFLLDMEQMTWRRKKKISLRHNFAEKYPEDDVSCLDGRACVVLANGTTKTIGDLVRRRYSGLVRTIGPEGRITIGKVVGWHQSKRKDRKIYRLTYEHAKTAHNTKTGVILTEEHKVMTSEGWERADACEGKLVATGTPAPGPRAKQVILGTILGDAHLTRRKLACTQIDSEYINFKAQVLENFGTSACSTFVEGGYSKRRRKVWTFYTKPCSYFDILRSKFYPKGIKVVPWDVIDQLDDFGLAVWFMDDGWIRNRDHDHPVAGLHLGLWSREVGDELVARLTARGYECRCNQVQGKYRVLNFTQNGSRKFFKAIAKYVTPRMRYKLPEGSPQFQRRFYASEKVVTLWDIAHVEEIDPPRCRRSQYERSPYYCIDVEKTHNFVTLGGVVHNCFLSNARMFYDAEIAAARNTELVNYEPLSIERNGELRIFQKPIPGRRYVCGADPAEGKQVNNEESDWSASSVIDEETGEQCASLRVKTSPENFALDLVELCQFYNQALLVIERNNHGATVILSVRETGYGNVYKHKEWTKRERSRGGKNQNTTKAQFQEWEGWPENVRTRKMMLNKSRDFLEHYPELIWDVDLMSEIMVFVYDEKGVPKAIEGYHDDRVFGWALAHIGRLVQIGYVDPLTFKVRKYGESEDATQEENE